MMLCPAHCPQYGRIYSSRIDTVKVDPQYSAIRQLTTTLDITFCWSSQENNCGNIRDMKCNYHDSMICHSHTPFQWCYRTTLAVSAPECDLPFYLGDPVTKWPMFWFMRWDCLHPPRGLSPPSPSSSNSLRCACTILGLIQQLSDRSSYWLQDDGLHAWLVISSSWWLWS